MNIYDDFYNKFPGYNGNGDSIIQHPQPCEFAVPFFKEKKNGVFIDVGAHNGVVWSNTLIFEKLFSWSGLCIEANESLLEGLRADRTCECLHCAIDDNEKEQTFWKIVGKPDGIGGLEKGFPDGHIERIEQALALYPDSICEKIPTTTRRLSSVLAEYHITHVDYLSIDVEGNELGVLKGFDFNACSCELISAESNDRASVQAYLDQFGYNLLGKFCADDFYAKK